MAEDARASEDLDEVEQLAWQGLLAVMLVGIPQVERTFRERGLVHIEYALLNGLNVQSMTLSELANLSNVSISRLSHRMSKLVDRGYVLVRPSEADGRVSVAEITDRGRELLAEIAPAHTRALREVIFDHLSKEQVAALAETMQHVGARLGACMGRNLQP
ncbi:hypothetical protein [Nonomuraea sp. NPDC050310]|uniref:MarR family winged helix-turn-helix transcriptional regulator n=1 Tax=Nonomuraea sp. NPDC050310 TaxID=3154935 RepID=UPI0033D4CFC3